MLVMCCYSHIVCGCRFEMFCVNPDPFQEIQAHEEMMAQSRRQHHPQGESVKSVV